MPPHIHDHADGRAWVDESEKGFHTRELLSKLHTQQDDKHSSSHHHSASSHSPLDSPRRLFQLNLKEQERQAKAAEREHELQVQLKAQQAEDEKYSADQHKLLHLLTSMYRCRECMPTWKDREEQRLGIETNEYSSRRLNEYCCIGSALQSSFPPSLPLDLLPLMQAYLLTQPTRSFLTHPAPASAGVTQCYILKKSNRFELYMEMRDHTDWQCIRKRMIERGHLPDTQQTILPAGTTNSCAQGDRPQQSAAEKDRERSELLERLFRERQAMRQVWKGSKGSISPVNSGKGSSQSLGLEDRMKENNMKSMLLTHAEQLLMKNEDIFLLAATRKRAWRGNSYTITMEDDSSKTSSDSTGSREYIGKLKSNFGGTEFVMFDFGVKAGSKRGPGKRADKIDGGNGSVTPLSPLTPPLVGGTVPSLSSASGVSSGVGAGQRYQRESGVIQYDHFFEHTGSPIRIKIMLPNRSFYPIEQSQLSGSILRQYKAESKDTQQTGNSSFQTQQSMAGAQPPLADEDDEFTPPPNEATQSSSSASASASAFSSPPPSPSHSPLRPKSNEPDEYDYQTVGQHVEVFENLRPVWHDGMNAYVLHFDNHRVREKSVKNFKLVRVNDPEKRTVLQFGRVMDRNVFVMDFAWPLSPAQAFAICLSSIDPKIAV